MPRSKYKAKSRQGQSFQGVVEAEDENEASQVLDERGLEVVYLEYAGESEKEKSKTLNLPFLNQVKRKDVVIFSRQLSVMISANVSVVQSLRILIEQTSNPKLKKIVTDIADNVESGVKLSDALDRHSDVFSHFFVSMVQSGETSGKLDEVLLYLADQQEKDYDLVSKIRGAMIYPVFIIGGLLVVGTLMMIFVIPQLTSVLTETGVELPTSTKILIGTSNFFSEFWWLLFGVAVASVVGIRVLIKTPKGRFYWDTLTLRIPVFGKLFQKIILVRFARSLHTLTTGGVALTKSLEITADVVGNAVYRQIILQTVAEVEDGNSIATVFLRSKHVPVMVSQMLNLGEKTGRIDDILD